MRVLAASYGSRVSVLLSFEEDVRVSGSPQLQLEIGAQTRLAAYVPARRGRIAAFDYTVTADDAGSDGVSIRANTDASSPSLLLNGGAFRWVSFLRGEVIPLGFGAVSASSVHAVAGADADTTAPTLSAATIRFRRLVLTYSEPLHDDPQMMSGVATSSWSVTVNDAAVALASVTIGGERVTMELLSAVDHDDVVTVSSSVLMQDRAATPNVESALLDGRSVTNETPATKPVVAIAAGAGAYFEEESIMLTVSRSGEAADRLVVFLDYSQPRLLLEDPRVVVLEAGETSAQVAVPTKRRRPVGDRLLVIALLEDDAYDIGDPGSASVTVKDADASPVGVYTASRGYQDEPTSDRITNWTVQAVALEESGVPPEFRFLFSTESGTAEKNKDYRALDHRIGFRAEDFALGPWLVDGQEVQRWKALRRVPVEILADDEVEGDEVFFIVLEADNTTPENVTFPTRPIRQIIWDDDLEIDVAIQDPPSQIAENAGRTHITLAASVRRPYARGVSSGVKLTEERRSRSRTVRARAGNGDARCRCVGAVWSFRDIETAADAPYRVFNIGCSTADAARIMNASVDGRHGGTVRWVRFSKTSQARRSTHSTSRGAWRTGQGV